MSEEKEKGYSIGIIREHLKKESFLKELLNNSFLTDDQLVFLLWRHLNKDHDQSFERYNKKRRKTSARMMNSKGLRKIQKAFMTLYNVSIYTLLPDVHLKRLKTLIYIAFSDRDNLVKQYYHFIRGKERLKEISVVNFEKTEKVMSKFNYKSTFLTQKQALYIALYSWNYYHGVIRDIARKYQKNYDTVRKEIKKAKKNIHRALATLLISLYINETYDVFSDAFEFLEEIIGHALTYSDALDRVGGMEIYQNLLPALSKKIKIEIDGRRKFLLKKWAKEFEQKKGAVENKIAGLNEKEYTANNENYTTT